jgi:hypothetical protein
MQPRSKEWAMQQMAPCARQPLPVRAGALASPAALQHRPLPHAARRSRVIGGVRWLFRLLFVQPVGRRAREERLGALPDRILRDIGVRRAELHAAACGVVRLCDLVRNYPSAGPLYICGRPGHRPTIVQLSKAA